MTGLEDDQKMRVALGNDHAGFPAKAAVIDHLRSSGVDLVYCVLDPRIRYGKAEA